MFTTSTTEQEYPTDEFTFCHTDCNGAVNSVSFSAENYDEVLSYFQDFLRGSGFYFDGSVEIIEDTSPFVGTCSGVSGNTDNTTSQKDLETFKRVVESMLTNPVVDRNLGAHGLGW